MSLKTQKMNGPHIYRKDLSSGEVAICSTNSRGEPAESDSSFPDISADGRYVVFESYASNLVEGDRNRRLDVFRKDLETGEVVICSSRRRGGNGDSRSGNISADGRYVAFSSSSDNYVPGDDNGMSDIYRWEAPFGAEPSLSGPRGREGPPRTSLLARKEEG